MHSSFASILIGKIELVALLCFSSWCLVIVVWLFLTMPRFYLQFVIVVFSDHTHLLYIYGPALVCVFNLHAQNPSVYAHVDAHVGVSSALEG